MVETAREMEKLVAVELARIADADRRAALSSLLVPPVPLRLGWDYGAPGERLDCWQVGQSPDGTVLLLYCDQGFGPGSPWGFVGSADDALGMDSQWDERLEHTAIVAGLLVVPRRKEGFAIIRSADSVIQEYLAMPPVIQNRHLIDQLWAAIAPHDPKSYRGIGCILQGIGPPPSGWDEPKWLATLNVNVSDPLLKASLALGSFNDDDLEAGDLLVDADQVRQVLSLAPSGGPSLDVVKVRRAGFVNSSSMLGFDVGYWGGDHFSTICDSIVTPTWHPPPPEDFVKLAKAVAGLNEHLLFRTADAAAAWCARYKEFPWAETEGYPGEFAVIQLELADVP